MNIIEGAIPMSMERYLQVYPNTREAIERAESNGLITFPTCKALLEKLVKEESAALPSKEVA